ncbi:zf-HC2 domain-containing protein [Catenuloplanes japonicus]|uniref:zf-HC2 domain-containing protein n=1 Tax=Catenuloplanes japonicus TaxID=33876 RepID=UPI000525BD17|nr:zf-HC2 domain-containing protein [Catenuloplanes japonicus]
MTGYRCSDDAARALLGLHALGRLSDAEDRQIRAHLADCLSCGAEFAELRAVTAALDLLSPADIAELLVADHADAPAEHTAKIEPAVRLACRFALNQRYSRGTSGPPVRRPGKRPAPQLPRGRPRER